MLPTTSTSPSSADALASIAPPVMSPTPTIESEIPETWRTESGSFRTQRESSAVAAGMPPTISAALAAVVHRSATFWRA
jgi:hypothetical protein